MYKYPIRLTAVENNQFMVEFLDIPQALTYGETKEEALSMAQNVLDETLDKYMSMKLDIPKPSQTRDNDITINASPMIEIKLSIYQTMQEKDSSTLKEEHAIHFVEICKIQQTKFVIDVLNLFEMLHSERNCKLYTRDDLGFIERTLEQVIHDNNRGMNDEDIELTMLGRIGSHNIELPDNRDFDEYNLSLDEKIEIYVSSDFIFKYVYFDKRELREKAQNLKLNTTNRSGSNKNLKKHEKTKIACEQAIITILEDKIIGINLNIFIEKAKELMENKNDFISTVGREKYKDKRLEHYKAGRGRKSK